MERKVIHCKRCQILIGYYELKKTFEFCIDCQKLNILILTIHSHWFGLIINNIKKIEYRLFKKHWRERLIRNHEPIKFDEILFINGYGDDKQYMFVEYKDLETVYFDKEELVNLGHKKHYAISLGKIKFMGNLKDETIIL